MIFNPSGHCEAPDYCVYSGDNHEPGETWTEDLCVECTCSADADATGEYTVECRNIKCGTCSSGFTYVPVAGACCGDCVPVTCHYDGVEYAVRNSRNVVVKPITRKSHVFPF